MKKREFLVAAFLFILIICPIFINISDFIYLGNSAFSDIPITHYPNTLYIQRTISIYHQIPLWSDQIFSGYPFFANPLSGLWYFPGWIAVIFPLPLGINLSIIVHLLLSYTGMILFLKKTGRSFFAALFGAIAFTLSAKNFSHIGAGHLTLIYALSWTPWLLRSVLQRNSNVFWKIVNPGLFMALIIMADPRWIVPAILLWISFSFTKDFLLTNKTLREIYQWTGQKLAALIVSLIASAIVWLPLLQYVFYSTRENLTFAESLNYSLGYEKLIGFFVPDLGGFAEWVIYPGAVILLLAVLSIFLYKENHSVRFWIFAAFISLLLSLGENVPLIKYIFALPGFDLLRVPSRFIFLFIFSFAVLAAFSYDYLIANKRDYKFDRYFFLFPFLFFILFFSLGIFLLNGELPPKIFWSLAIFSSSMIVIGLSVHKKIPPRTRGLVIFACLVIDLCFVNWNSLTFREKNDVLAINESLKTILISQQGIGRIYTPSYSISQEQAAYWGISQVNGIDPMQLKQYVKYFEVSSGIPYNGYSVTLPPFKSGTPAVDNSGYCPDLKYLQLLNTNFIVSDYPLQHCFSEIEEIQIEEKYVYQLHGNSLWSWLENESNARLSTGEPVVDMIAYTPNKISFWVEGPGEFNISEINYPGWIVLIDNLKSNNDIDELFRNFIVPDGKHRIDFVFRPKILFISLFISSISWIFCGVGCWVTWKKR